MDSWPSHVHERGFFVDSELVRTASVFAQEGGVIIRSQSPVMAGINDDAKVWNKKWKEEVRLGPARGVRTHLHR